MECLWCVYRYWQQNGNSNKPDSTVFYLCFTPYDGLSHYYLYDTGVLEKYAQVYYGGKKKSVVLLIRSIVNFHLLLTRIFQITVFLFSFTLTLKYVRSPSLIIARINSEKSVALNLLLLPSLDFMVPSI